MANNKTPILPKQWDSKGEIIKPSQSGGNKTYGGNYQNGQRGRNDQRRQIGYPNKNKPNNNNDDERGM